MAEHGSTDSDRPVSKRLVLTTSELAKKKHVNDEGVYLEVQLVGGKAP